MSRYLIKVQLEWDKSSHGGKLITHAPDAPTSNKTANVLLDFDNGIWIARSNWRALRDFLPTKPISGSILAPSDQYDALLFGRSPSEPSLRLLRFQLPSGFSGVPPMKGKAVWSTLPDNPAKYALITYWWRIRDTEIMGPFDRLCEMIDLACTDPTLKAKLRGQLGALATPMVLLPMAGVFFMFAGAEYLGGAAFITALQAIMGVGQALTDYAEFGANFKALHDLVMKSKFDQHDLDFGAGLIVEIILRIVSDMMTVLGIKAISAIVSKMAAAFRDCGEDVWRSKAKRKETEHSQVAKRQISNRYGYAGEQYLKDPKGFKITDAANKAHAEFAAEKQKIVVIREGKADQLRVLQSHVWVDGKPPWFKGKTSEGWKGFCCLSKTSGVEKGGLKPMKAQYDMGNLMGISDEIDSFARTNKMRPMYEMPTDGREIAGIHYGEAGAKNVSMQGHALVDLGNGKYMVVNKTKGPYVGDYDIAAIADPKAAQGQMFKDRSRTNQSGQNKPLSNPEDNLLAEFDINQRVWKFDAGLTNRPFNSAQHGGEYGSMGHGELQHSRGNTKYWRPYDKKTGQWENERLIVHLPIKTITGSKSSKAFMFDSWPDFKRFWEANNFKWPDAWNEI